MKATASCIPQQKPTALKGATPGPSKQTSAGQGLIDIMSSLRQERVGRADALVCLAERSNQTRSDPLPGREKRVAAVNCSDSSMENNDLERWQLG